MKDIRFTSESARKSIMADIAANVSVKDGKLIGFGDLLADAKKNDSGAFVDEQEEQNEENQAQFTTPMGENGGAKITGDPSKWISRLTKSGEIRTSRRRKDAKQNFNTTDHCE